MRNPGRIRNLTLVAGLLGVAALSVPFIVPDQAGQGAWVLLGGMVAVIGFGAALALTTSTRRMRRLNAGEGVIARWQVDPAIWSRFAAEDRKAELDKRKPNNAIRFRDPRGKPVHIIMGDDCLQVDGDFHKVELAQLKGAGLSAGPPAILEMRFVSPGAQQPDTHYAFRFPVAFGAAVAAQKAIDHYTARYRAKYG